MCVGDQLEIQLVSPLSQGKVSIQLDFDGFPGAKEPEEIGDLVVYACLVPIEGCKSQVELPVELREVLMGIVSAIREACPAE